MTGRLRDYAQRFATLAAPPRAHTCTPMLCSQGSSPPAQHPQAPTTLRAPGLTALLQRTNMARTPVALSAFNICQLCSAHCCQPHQPCLPLGFLQPRGFAQHLPLQYPRTDLIDVTPTIQVSLNAGLMHLCVQTSWTLTMKL